MTYVLITAGGIALCSFVGAVIYICADWPEPPVLPVDPDVET